MEFLQKKQIYQYRILLLLNPQYDVVLDHSDGRPVIRGMSGQEDRKAMTIEGTHRKKSSR
jgi:hypothetical protein